MKTLIWDSDDPLDVWDNPNLRWGSPSYRLEPGDPGYVPWFPPGYRPPRPKKKSFRRKTKLTTPPVTPTTTMPSFKYHVAPLAQGGFTTRAVRGVPADETALLTAVATTAGVTPAQAEATIKAFLNKVLECGAGCDWSPEMFGMISFRPTSGGRQPAPDGFHNPDDINADVAISFTAETIRNWRAGLTIESMGEVGKVTPVIETIIRQSDGGVDRYTAGSMIQIRGDYMNLTPANPTEGVFLKAGAAAEVRVTDYAAIEPQSIIVLVPAGLAGPLTVRIATFINGSVRSYTYTNTITP